MKYFETFSEPGFHSAFLTTFSFSSSAFEDIALSRLRSVGCRNIVVVADENMLNEEFSQFGIARLAGKYYHLVKEKREGAFHPKIMLQLGRDRARLIITSANLTATGLAGNLELVSVVECSGNEDPSAPLMLAALKYFSTCVTSPDAWFHEGLHRATARTPWLSTDLPQDQYVDSTHGLTALLHDQSPLSMIDQFTDLVSSDLVHRFTVVSPFWDEALVALKRLKQGLGDPLVRVLVERERGLFPRDAAHDVKDLSIHDLTPLQANRRLHAKLFIAEGQMYDHVLAGSMNCSVAALMHINGKSRNAEVGLYRRVPAGMAVEAMGFSACFETQLNASELPPLQEQPEATIPTKVVVDGGSLTKRGTQLAWTPPQTCSPAECCLSLIGTDGNVAREEIVFQATTDSTWITDLGEEKMPRCYGIVQFPDGSQSAPIIICDLDAIQVASREVHRGRKAQLLSALEEAIDEDLHILEILIELQQLSDASTEGEAMLRRLKQRASSAEPEQPPAKLSYRQFIEGRDKSRGRDAKGVGKFQAETHLSDVRSALNRIIGIVAPFSTDLGQLEDKVEADLSPTEPTNEDPANPDPIEHRQSVTPQIVARNRRAERERTADELVSAVRRFTDQMNEGRQQPITFTELVHLRALLQIVLAHSIPRGEKPDGKRVLPAYESSSENWSRLVAKLIQSLFVRGADPFASLELPADQDQVPEAILECWAAIAASISLALSVTRHERSAGPIRTPLERFQVITAARIKSEIFEDADAHRTYAQFLEKFETRFAYLKV